MISLEAVIGQEYIEKIEGSSFGSDKISALEDESLLEFFVNNDFNGYHISQIVHGSDWRGKLNWAKTNFKEVLEPMGFNGYHYSQIVVGQGWEDKLNWVENHYSQVMQYHKFNPSQTAKIIKGKGWQEKIEWIETQYKTSNLTPAKATKEPIKKDWKEQLHYAA